ncbi:MAG: glycosyltransferase family 4 protein [Chloroflexota bacterium]
MRIALYHNVPSGGAKRAIYEWVRRLAPSHEIDVYTLSTADQAFADVRPLVRRHTVVDFVPRRLFNSPWGRLNRLQRWRDLDDLMAISRELAGRISSNGYDVVFTNTCTFTFIPTIIQFLKVPSVYYAHEPFGRASGVKIRRPYLEGRGWRRWIDRVDPLISLYGRRLDHLQERSVHHCGLLLANSRFTKDRVESAFRVETPVCYLGVDSAAFRPIPGAARENYVVSVGELSPRKGFDFVVDSLRRIPLARRPSLRLVCNSVNAQERAYVETLAVQGGVDLQILTNLSAEELAVQYNEARLCVYAPVMEPFGLVPLEAMACGTPVVGVREGGVQETVVHEHTGLLVDRDPSEFAAAVQYLLDRPGLAAEYGDNGRQTVLERWTWEQSVAALEQHLRACAGEGKNDALATASPLPAC